MTSVLRRFPSAKTKLPFWDVDDAALCAFSHPTPLASSCLPLSVYHFLQWLWAFHSLWQLLNHHLDTKLIILQCANTRTTACSGWKRGTNPLVTSLNVANLPLSKNFNHEMILDLSPILSASQRHLMA